MRHIESLDVARKERVPKGQFLTDKFPVLHYGRVPEIDISKWTFKIWGLVDKEVELSFAQFDALPKVSLHCDIHCVTTWSKLDTHWVGVQSQELLNLCKPHPQATHVLVHAYGNWSTNLTFEDFFTEDVIFATEYEGKPVTADHGGPIRLVVPRLYFWKSAKWVTSVQFLPREVLGFWEKFGYHRHGDPWKEERYGY
jgi:DMSO/TMAO reductase YedYZ molybdopterin-dependent catalytic subunit